MACDPSVPASPASLAYADCFAQTVDYAARSAVYFGPKTAVVDVERGAAGRFDYTTLNDRATRLGHFLRSRGVERGDRVGLLGQNGVEYIDLVLACAKLGAVFAPYNYRLHPSELHEVVAKTGPKAFVYGPEYAEHAAYLRPSSGAQHLPAHRTGPRWRLSDALSFEAVVTQTSHDGPRGLRPAKAQVAKTSCVCSAPEEPPGSRRRR
jgi:acyl-CoA synthetase (AMP-forming)/AMP-acid ligase II